MCEIMYKLFHFNIYAHVVNSILSVRKKSNKKITNAVYKECFTAFDDNNIFITFKF